MLDVFKGDAFNVVSLTESFNRLPYVPSRISRMGLFRGRGITTTTVLIEEAFGQLSLIPTAARGTMPNVYSGPNRKIRPFLVPHVPYNAGVQAADVQGVRAFGTEDNTQAVATIINDKLAGMRQDHEVTMEYHRLGALKGVILDADGSSVIYNLFTEFGISLHTADIDFGADSVKATALDIKRYMRSQLGATPFTGIHALVGDDYFDWLTSKAEVADAYAAFNENEFARVQQDGEEGFPYGGIVWENFSGSVGSVDFIAANEARFFPTGVPGLFTEYYAPANFMETVNTVGKPVYAKQQPLPFDVGIELHTQSNALMMCTRPSVLVKSTGTAP